MSLWQACFSSCILSGNLRFWWRDTRLSELVPLPPSLCTSTTHSDNVSPAHTTTAQQIFSYPTLLLPVPYCSDLSSSSLLSSVIPLARSTRSIEILLPPELGSPSEEQGMDIDHRVRGMAEVYSDGLLLYVSQASYEPGTSPLSSWVPGRSLTEGRESPLTIFERYFFLTVIGNVIYSCSDWSAVEQPSKARRYFGISMHMRQWNTDFVW